MAERVLIKGNDALSLAALKSGMAFFAGYPITPASEIPEYLAEKYQTDQSRIERGEAPEFPGFTFLQAESEVASINMVLGAAATGARTMTASSSPGVSLMMEAISYVHGCELPAVVVNVMRGGPGLGNIAPEQSDYSQAVKGGGHGNYRNIVLAPNSVQEMYDFMPLAFDLAFRYRIVVFVLVDGCLGQMQESILINDVTPCDQYTVEEWALDTDPDRERRLITSLRIEPEDLEQHILNLKAKYDVIQSREARSEAYLVDDADWICVSYGITSRITKGAVNALRREGLKVGMLRPQTLWPFPAEAIQETVDRVKAYLCVELSLGQMQEDVLLAVKGRRDVELYHRLGGVLPSEKEIANKVRTMTKTHC